MKRSIGFSIVAAALSATAFSSFAADVAWPSKPIQVVVPAGAGGDTDFNARTMAKYFEKITGKSMVVTNMNGGGGTIAMSQVKGSAPDGNTILFAHTGQLIVAEVSGITKDNFDTFDVSCIAGVDKGVTLVTSQKSGIKSVQDLVTKAKAAPGSVIYGTELGGYSHLQGLMLEKKAGIKLKIVDTGSASDKITNLLGGRIDLSSISYGSVQDYGKTGKMNIVAQYNNQANPLIPGVKTFREQGIQFDMEKPYIVSFPKGTNPEIVKKMSDVMKQITEMPAYAKDLEQGFKQPVSFYNTKDAIEHLRQARTEFMQFSDLLQQKK